MRRCLLYAFLLVAIFPISSHAALTSRFLQLPWGCHVANNIQDRLVTADANGITNHGPRQVWVYCPLGFQFLNSEFYVVTTWLSNPTGADAVFRCVLRDIDIGGDTQGSQLQRKTIAAGDIDFLFLATGTTATGLGFPFAPSLACAVPPGGVLVMTDVFVDDGI